MNLFKAKHTKKHTHASELIQRAGLMQDYALECYDTQMFFKYHRIAMRLIQYRINLFKR